MSTQSQFLGMKKNVQIKQCTIQSRFRIVFYIRKTVCRNRKPQIFILPIIRPAQIITSNKQSGQFVSVGTHRQRETKFRLALPH